MSPLIWVYKCGSAKRPANPKPCGFEVGLTQTGQEVRGAGMSYGSSTTVCSGGWGGGLPKDFFACQYENITKDLPFRGP